MTVMVMSGRSKLGVVLASYAVALLAAFVVSYARSYVEARVDPAQASGGMQAFGDMLFFFGLYGLLALVPTAMALYFLRPFEKFWTVFSTASLALSATGLLAELMMRRAQQFPWAMFVVGFFGLLKILGAPLFGMGFLICAALAPFRRPRRVLLAAAAVEFTVCAYAIFCFLVLGHWAI